MSTALHAAGAILPGGEPGELWITGGRISFEPVPDAESLGRDVFLVPGLVDAHCHPGIGVGGPVSLEEAAEQAITDRDAGTLLIRDCGLPIDVRPLQQRADLPMIIRAGREAKFSTRKKNRCKLCGRPRAFMRQFALCRICFRELALNGQLPGVKKSSW